MVVFALLFLQNHKKGVPTQKKKNEPPIYWSHTVFLWGVQPVVVKSVFEARGYLSQG